MNRMERLVRIDHLINQYTVVPLQTFLDQLEVSHATFKRDLDYLRDRLNAPIVWDRDAGGYRFEQSNAGQKYELPGLWFNASEIYALLTMQHLLKGLNQGILSHHVEPLLTRLRMLLDNESISADVFERKIRIQQINARTYEPEHFMPIASAVLQSQRLEINHYNKGRNESLLREISPQRLNYCRENWYLYAWCHLRNELRTFSLDSILQVKTSPLKFKSVSEKELNRVLESGYGVFSGTSVEWAELAFSSERARWVSHEQWHPEQESWIAKDGTYHLRVPYNDPRELMMEILKHVPDVKVVSPKSLRAQLKEKLQAALEHI